MILVTGAGGKTGRAVVSALRARSAPVRVLVRRSQYRDALRDLGAQEVLVGDMRDPGVWRRAIPGVDTIYHICPNVAPDELEIATIALQSASEAGAPRFVFHSVMHPQTEAMPHHWNKLRVEELILQSGLPFTVLQPSAYMQNVLTAREQIDKGVFPVPYGGETKLAMVDLMDVAHVAADVLLGSGHDGATYQLCGPEVLTQTQVAAALSLALDQEIRVKQVPLDRWEQDARAAGMSDHAVHSLLAMFRYYQCYGFWGNANVLRWLLGREPTTFVEFAAREFGACTDP
ncbi:MAG: SDR family oxidoreductase [Chloroflexota bacterium]